MKLPGKIRDLLTQVMTTYFRFVVMGAALLVALIGFFTVIQPQLHDVQLTGILEVQRKTNTLAARQQYLDRAKRMVDAYSAIEPEAITKANRILPASAEVPELFIILEKIALNSAMKLESISISKGSSITAVTGNRPATADTGQGTASAATRATGSTVNILNISFTISGSGSYDAYKRLLANIEQSERLFDLSSISFSVAGEGEDQTGTQQYSFELKTYYLTSAVTK